MEDREEVEDMIRNSMVCFPKDVHKNLSPYALDIISFMLKANDEVGSK